MSKDQKYVLTLKGPVTISELEIAPDVAAKVVRLVMPVAGDVTVPPENRSANVAVFENDSTGVMTAKQFMALKQPKSDVERVTCLAFYLAHNKEMPAFKTIDLTHLNVEAAQPRISNPSLTARNAVTQQYLAPAGGGRKQITPRGEALVNAMPDRSAVKDALEQHPLHGKKRKTSAKKTKKKSA